MRLAVVGPEGTGKSALAARLGQALELAVLPSPRDVVLAESGYHTLFEWVAAGHEWADLVRRQCTREAAVAAGIIDAGVLDQYCSFQRWGWNRTSPERAEEMYVLVLSEARRYDRILVTPPRLVAGSAPARFRNVTHNLQLARLLDALVRDTNLSGRALVLADGTLDERVAQATAFVSG